jgi:hypothetical protein
VESGSGFRAISNSPVFSLPLDSRPRARGLSRTSSPLTDKYSSADLPRPVNPWANSPGRSASDVRLPIAILPDKFAPCHDDEGRRNGC